MYRGRKITDPLVHGVQEPEGVDLARVWDNVGRAKAELRKIEHRLGDADRHPIHLNETGETSITAYTDVDRLNHRYNLTDRSIHRPEFPSGAIVDSYGRSVYYRNRHQGTRKISRMGDKYNEIDNGKKTSAVTGLAGKARMAGQDNGTTRCTNDDEGCDEARCVSPKRVDFHERLDMRQINPDGSYIDSTTYGRDVTSNTLSNITDSRAIRETEIRFINEDLPPGGAPSNVTDVRWHPSSARLTHVNVTVPDSRKISSSTKVSSSGALHGRDIKSVHSRNRNSEYVDRRPDGQELSASIDSISDGDHSIPRKFQKNLKHIGQDGLTKIKEKIRQQRMNSSQREKESELHSAQTTITTFPTTTVTMATAMTASTTTTTPAITFSDNVQTHTIHAENEPVLPQGYTHFSPTEKQPKIRKIAAGPPVPSYKGFSEADSRLRLHGGKISKVSEIKRKVRKKSDAEQEEEINEDKVKKVTRVIAASKKSSSEKQKKGDIITTSTWRSGRELVIRELGPYRSTKSSHSTGKTKDSQTTGDLKRKSDDNRPDGSDRADSTSAVRQDPVGTDLERAKILSSEARKVLDDLHLENEASKTEKRRDEEYRRRASVKRKAPRPDSDKQQPLPKQRHYNADEVRRFMAKQKAERLKKQKDEHKAQQHANEQKQKQLEELYMKQKQSSHVPKPRSESRSTSREKRQSRNKSFNELSKQFFINDKLARQMGLGDRENQLSAHEDDDVEMNMSDGSSTLTGESQDESTPVATPRGERSESGRTKGSVSAKHKSNSVPSSNTRTVGNFTFNIDSVMSKFSDATQVRDSAKRDAISDKGTTKVNSGYSSSNSEGPAISRTRDERIQAIKATSVTLLNRIQAESRRLTGDVDMEDEDERGTRYDRLVGRTDDYTVFSSNLPGREIRPEEAATKIQAAYRGHNVRQTMRSWELPSGQTLASKIQGDQKRVEEDADDSSLTETSTFGDLTITEESDDSLSSQNKIGAKLKTKESGATRKNRASNEAFMSTRAHPATHGNWQEPQSDPHSVLNIYAQHYKNYERKPTDLPFTEDATAIRMTNTLQETTNRYTPSSSTGNRKLPATASEISAHQTTRKSNSRPTVSSESSQPYPSQDLERKPKPMYGSSGYMPIQDQSEADDGDDDASYTNTVDSDEDLSEGSTKRKRSLTDRILLKSSHSRSRATESNHSDVSSVTDEEISAISREIPSERREAANDDTSYKEPLRYSPNALERRMAAELNRLESMEESIRQLSAVEKTRGISLAQQETVSLAQILKARQQEYDRDRRTLEIKTQQEAYEVTKQIEEAQRRAAEAAQTAAETIAKVRGESSGIQESTRRLIETQSEAARATARVITEMRGLTRDAKSSVTGKPGSEKKNRTVKYELEEERPVPDTARTVSASMKTTSKTSQYSRTATPSYTSKSKSRSRDSSVTTARDESDSRSIRTATDAEGRDESHSESISEELSAQDYSYIFDDTMTEDEIEERSFRQVLPSESHRRRARRQSDNMSLTSEEGSDKIKMDEMHSLFTKEESFNKFTEEMVKQFMREEELRATHQAALLRLREKALKEKAKVEMAWLKQQKHAIRNKGADDVYPEIKKKQQNVIMKYKEQQAEIKRLKQAQEMASKERQRLLKQHQEISKMKEKTQQTLVKIKDDNITGRLARPDEIHTEDEFEITVVSDLDETSIKDYKSDSEIYREPKSARKTKDEAKNLKKFQKNFLDERGLTERQKKLKERKKNAEELLAWKARLDREEKEVAQLEEQAAKRKRRGKEKQRELEIEKEKKENRTDVKSLSVKDDKDLKSEPITKSITEHVSTAKDESFQWNSVGALEPVSELRKNASKSDSRGKSLGPTGSETSIPEEIPSNSVDKKVLDSSDDTIVNSSANDDYNADTFEQSTSTAHSKKLRMKVDLNPSKLVSPFRNNRKGSESESEDSVSQQDTLSDMSDYEGRIRALSDELSRRKYEAEKLKKEHKQKRREKMKQKEESLKKQLEAYENIIGQLKSELTNEIREPSRTSVKPKIKQPKVAKPKSHSKEDIAQRSESDGGRSRNSSSQEDSNNEKSPPVTAEKAQKWKSGNATPDRKILDKISEGSESTSDKSKTATHKTQSSEISVGDSSIQEAIEGGSHVDSFSEDKSYSNLIHLSPKLPSAPLAESTALPSPNKSQLNDGLSYSEDFTGATRDGIPHSARSYLTDDLSFSQSESVPFIKKLDLKNDLSDLSERNKYDKSSARSHEFSGQREESDSDGQPLKSEATVSRPSSEKSTGTISTTHSEDFDHDEDSFSSEPDKIKVTAGLPTLSSDIKDIHVDHEEKPISARSDKSHHTQSLSQQTMSILDELLGEEEEKTPIQSPRISPPPEIKADKETERGSVTKSPEPEEAEESIEESLSVETDSSLIQTIKRAGENVEMFNLPQELSQERKLQRSPEKIASDLFPVLSLGAEKPDKLPPLKTSKNNKEAEMGKLADRITDQLTVDIINDAVSTIKSTSEQKKTPPPVAPKPHKRTDSSELEHEERPRIMNGGLEFSSPDLSPDVNIDNTTNTLMNNLVTDAITDMIKLKQQKTPEKKSPTHSQVFNHTESFDEKVELNDISPTKSPPKSPTDEINRVLEKPDSDRLSPLLRPTSPMPDESEDFSEENSEEWGKNVDGLIGITDDYHDDDLLQTKQPPPYPGAPNKDAVTPMTPSFDVPEITEELYAIPHKKDEVLNIVSSAVDAIWTHWHRCGEPLDKAEPPDSYFVEEEKKLDLENKSRKVYKRLLFDLTGDIIRDIYKEDEETETPVWRKNKRKHTKYFRGGKLPETLDILRVVVQDAVIDMIGLNGSRKSDHIRNKWNVRKKKDHVDKILVQELHEEEPDWINYDDDELAVKSQLTEAIFDSLISDTVQTVNNIYRKRQQRTNTKS